MPRWLGPALAVGTITGIGRNPGGTIVLGALWLMLTAIVAGERYRLRPATA